VSTTLLYSQDPGGAGVLAPLAARLVATGTAPLTLAVHPLSQPAFARAGVEGQPLETWFETRPVPETALRRWLESLGVTRVICSLSSRYRDLTNCRLVISARAAGIPTLGFMDSWVGFDRFVDDDGRAVYLPDVAGCIDEASRARLVALGMAPGAVRAVGQPRLEEALAVGRRTGNGGTIGVLLVSQPRVLDRSFAGLFETPVPGGRLIDRLAAAFETVERRQPVRVELRPHPKETAGAAPPAPIALDRTGARDVPYRRHDVLVGLTSTMLVEAALAGRIVVRLRVPELDDALEDLDLPFALGLTVRDLDELGPVLAEAVRLAAAGEPPPGQALPDVRRSLDRTAALARAFLVVGADTGRAESSWVS